MNGLGAPVGGAGKPTPLLIRILMIGDSSVGKTSLVLRYDKRGFNLRFTTTIGVDYSDRLLELDGRQVKLQVRRGDAKVHLLSPGDAYTLHLLLCPRRNVVGVLLLLPSCVHHPESNFCTPNPALVTAHHTLYFSNVCTPAREDRTKRHQFAHLPFCIDQESKSSYHRPPSSR